MADPLHAKMAQLASRFAAEAGQHRAELAAACAAQDRGAIAAKAHNLAGIAPMLGYTAIGEVALALEEAAEGGGDYSVLACDLDAQLVELAP